MGGLSRGKWRKGLILGFLSDALDELERGHSPRKRVLGLRSEPRYQNVPDSTLVPRSNLKGLSYSAVAVKRLRDPKWFYFEIDTFGKTGAETANKKAEILLELLEQLPKDFKKGFEISETKNGYHVVARMEPSQFKSLFSKYKKIFKESDFVDTGENLGLRISPKISLTTGEILSHAPKTIISTIKNPIKKAPKSSVYLTNV